MNLSQVTLSIAMITYNGERFLQQQIDSICKQSYQDFELIICDDQSSDNTINIIHASMLRYPHLTLYQNSEHLGSVRNFEKAISLCMGNYIALADQDDIWVDNKLEILMNNMKEQEKSTPDTAILIHSDLRMINAQNEPIADSYFTFRDYALKKEKDLSHILGPCGVMGNTMLINRALKTRILPFPDNLAVHDYWIALINEVYGKRVTLSHVLVQYRIHDKNLSNSSQILSHSKTRKNFLTYQLPYLGTGRERVLHTFLLTHTVPAKDSLLIKKFLNYLEFKNNKLLLYYTAVKYDFLKRSFSYRFKLFFKILFYNRNNPQRRKDED